MNLVCKIGLATAAIAATLAIACTLPELSEPEPARRQPYTPYPTFTPAPAVPTQTPLYSNIAPTADPNAFKEMGREELFFGSAGTEYKTGRSLMSQGDYQGAIAAFSRAQVHHGEPSAILENRIGIAFQGLNDHTQAIAHLTVAIAIEDSPRDRTNRAKSYLQTGRCDLAINDANQTLAMTPEYTEGLHTDAEANTILAICYSEMRELLKALQHADAAQQIMREHGYPAEHIETMETIEGAIRSAMGP